ncbi:hypothetical protein [Bordetella genomosp. 11]|nr:hypothetical protein [Bordetella genomosp. 11]
MKTALACLGSVALVMWLLGSFGALDFYVCVGPVGKCVPNVTTKENHE